MNRTRMLLLHHWRRTRLWLIPPLLLSVAHSITAGYDILHTHSLEAAWDRFHFGMGVDIFIFTAATLGLVMAMGSGESNAAFPRYAQTLPVSDRRWSFSYILYSILVLSVLAGIVTLVDWHVWNKAVTVEKARVATVAKQAEQAARQNALSYDASAVKPETAPQSLNNAQAEPARSRSVARVQPFGRFDNPFTGNRGKAAKNSMGAAPLAAPRRLPAPPHMPWDYYFRWQEPLFLVGVVFFCQSLFVALTLVQRVPIRVFGMAVAFILAPATAIFLTFQFGYTARHVPDYLFFQFAFPVLLLMLGSVIMHRAAKRERHGGIAFQWAAEMLGRQLGHPRLGFPSPARALAWYDWITFGRYLICGAAGAAIAFTLIIYVFNEFSRPEITGVPVLPICALAGLYLAYRLYYGDRQDNDAYLVTLPVSVERLSKSRLIAVSKFVAAASVIAVLLETCIILGYFTLFNHFYWPQASLWILLAPLCGWVLIWLIGPLFYPAIATWFLAVAVAVLLQVLLPRNHVVQQDSEAVALLAGLCLSSAFVLAATIWLVRRAKRRNLLFKWNKRLAVWACLATAVIAMPTLWFELNKSAGPFWYVVVLPLCLILPLCLLPAAPFIALPLAIDRYRHRCAGHA